MQIKTTIFDLIKDDEIKFNNYFNNLNENERPFYKKKINKTEVDNIYEKIQKIENARLEIYNKKLQDALKSKDSFNEYLALENKLGFEKQYREFKKNDYEYTINEINIIKNKIFDEIFKDDEKDLLFYNRKIIYKNYKNLPKLNFEVINKKFTKQLSELNDIKLLIISEITDLDKVFNLFNDIHKYILQLYFFPKINDDQGKIKLDCIYDNYNFYNKFYGINPRDIKKGENYFFKLNEYQLFILMLNQNLTKNLSIIEQKKLKIKIIHEIFIYQHFDDNPDFKRFDKDFLDHYSCHYEEYINPYNNITLYVDADRYNPEYINLIKLDEFHYEILINIKCLIEKFSYKELSSFSNENILILIKIYNLPKDKKLIKKLLKLDTDKLKLLIKIESLSLVMRNLGNYKESFIDLSIDKLMIFSEFKKLNLVIYHLAQNAKLKSEEYRGLFLNFDTKKLKLFSAQDNLYRIIEGLKQYKKLFLELDTDRLNKLFKIPYIKDIISHNLKDSQELFFKSSSDTLDVFIKSNSLNSILRNLSSSDQLIFFNLDINRLKVIFQNKYFHLFLYYLSLSNLQEHKVFFLRDLDEEILSLFINMDNSPSLLSELKSKDLLKNFFQILRENNLDSIKQILFDIDEKIRETEKICELVNSHVIQAKNYNLHDSAHGSKRHNTENEDQLDDEPLNKIPKNEHNDWHHNWSNSVINTQYNLPSEQFFQDNNIPNSGNNIPNSVINYQECKPEILNHNTTNSHTI